MPWSTPSVRDQCRLDPGAHAVLIVDQAVGTSKLAIPDNITVAGAAATIARVEPDNVRQFMRDLSNRIFKSYEDIVADAKPGTTSLQDHVPRHAQMGAWVLINESVLCTI